MTARWTWTRGTHWGSGDLYLLRCGDRDGSVELSTRLTDPTPVLNALCAALGDVTPAGESKPIDPKTRQRIHIGMPKLDHKYRDRATRLAALSAFIGRELATSSDLTEDEGQAILARIDEKMAKRSAA